MKPIRYRKGNDSFWTIIKIALMVVVLLIAFNIAYKLITGKNILGSLFKPYTSPQLEDNAYFVATEVYIENVGKRDD